MTLDRYNQLQRFWKKWPPTQVLLAGYVGYKPPGSATDETDGENETGEMSDEGMAALIEVFGPLPIKLRGKQDGEG